jgi:hypothetical protein
MSEKGPTFDRTLMRIKDFIIISTAIFAMLRWTYQQKEDITQRMRGFEERLTIAERNISTLVQVRKNDE